MNGFDISLLIPLVAIVFGSLTVLIPVVGLTLRFALKPIMEMLTQYREAQGQGREVHLLEQRISLMEEKLHGMERALTRLVDESEFERQLRAPRETAGTDLG